MTNINTTFGAVFDGSIVTMVLYGITCGQLLKYCRSYVHDSGMLKATVAFVWILETLQLCLVIHLTWYYMIELRSKPPSPEVGVAVWSLIAQVIPTEITAAIVESFFIYRIWMLVHKQRWPLLMLIPIAICFMFTLAYVVKCYLLPEFIDAIEYPWLVGVFAGSRALTDVCIALTMSVILFKNYNAEFTTRTTSILIKLVHYTIATGVLTSLLAFIYLIVYLSMPTNMIYIGVYFVHGKIYVNSMLAMLNGRQALRGIMSEGMDMALSTVDHSQRIRVDMPEYYQDERPDTGATADNLSMKRRH